MAGKATGKAQGRSRPQAQGKERQGKQNPDSGRGGSSGPKGGAARNTTTRKGGGGQRGKARPEAPGRERMHPRQSQDEGQEQAQQEGQGAAGVSKVADTARQHPITTAAIGAGLTLLAAQGLRMAISSMSDNGAAGTASRQRQDQQGGEEDSPQGSYSEEDEGEEGEEDEGQEDDDSPEASAGGEDEGDEAEGEEDEQGGGSGFTGRMRGVGSALRSSGDAIKRGARSGFERGRETADQNWQTHPLMLCGLALAVGAAAGFLLPATRQEDQMMGEASDKMTGRLRKTSRKFVRQGRQIAGKVVSEAVSTTAREAEREGLTPDRLGKKVKRVVGSVRNAVSNAVQDE